MTLKNHKDKIIGYLGEAQKQKRKSSGETDTSTKSNEISVSTGDISNIKGGASVFIGGVHGDVYQNTTVKKTFRYTYQPGDLTEEQASKLQKLVNDIAELEKTVKKTPKGYAAIWSALRRRFKVGYYRKIREEDFEKAESYLRMWTGKLSKSLRQKDPDAFRKRRYSAIFSTTKDILDWSKEDVDNYLYQKYGVSSVRSLSDDQLQKFYNWVMGLKKKRNKV